MSDTLRPPRRAAGFTLIELLVVLALMAVITSLGLPQLFNMIGRQKLVGTAQQTAMLLRLARLQAIRTATQTVAEIDPSTGAVLVFTDTNADQTFNTGEPLLGKIPLPKGISFGTVDQFTVDPHGTLPNMAVFRTNGSVATAGAFRFQNLKGDQFEVRVVTANGGLVQIRKLQGSTYKEQGEGGQSWTWN